MATKGRKRAREVHGSVPPQVIDVDDEDNRSVATEAEENTPPKRRRTSPRLNPVDIEVDTGNYLHFKSFNDYADWTSDQISECEKRGDIAEALLMQKDAECHAFQAKKAAMKKEQERIKKRAKKRLAELRKGISIDEGAIPDDDEAGEENEEQPEESCAVPGGGGTESKLPPRNTRGENMMRAILAGATTEEDIDDALRMDSNGLTHFAVPPLEYVKLQLAVGPPPESKAYCFACQQGGPGVGKLALEKIAEIWDLGYTFSRLDKLSQQVYEYYQNCVRYTVCRGSRGQSGEGDDEEDAILRDMAQQEEGSVVGESDAGLGVGEDGGRAPINKDVPGRFRSASRTPGVGEGLPEWSVATILEHFTEHILDPAMTVGECMRDLKIIKKSLMSKGVFNRFATSPHDVQIKESNHRMLLATMREMRAQMQMDIESLPMYRPGRSSQCVRAGPKINPQKKTGGLGAPEAGETILTRFLSGSKK